MTPYGPGVLSYFDLYYELMKVFAIMTLLAIPMIGIYYYMGGMRYLEADQSIVQMFSFGNMGFSNSICQKDVVLDYNSQITLYSECQNTTHISGNKI